jgi:predicted Zn-dependent protease
MPARLYDGRTAVAHPVAVTLKRETLRIEAEDGDFTLDWPLARIDASASSVPDGAVVVISGAAQLVLDDPQLAARLRDAVRRRRRGWSRRVAIALAGVLVAGFAVDRLPSLAATLFPDWAADRIGAAVRTGLFAGQRTCTAPQGQQALQALVDRLAQAGGLAAPVRVEVVDAPLVNAYTLPGRRIIVLRRLIARADDSSELAGVLAHEMGHVLHRDPERTLLRMGLVSGIVIALGVNDSGVGEMLIHRSYGRAAEAAADTTAIDLLRRAGLRADGLSRFLAQFEAQEGKGVPPGSRTIR